MQKLYAYVDETGSDISSNAFLVSVVIIEHERDDLIQRLERIERQTQKYNRKWSKVKRDRRRAYIGLIFSQPIFKGKFYYNHTAKKNVNFLQFTVQTTAQAIRARAQAQYKVTVLIDGLSKTDERKYAKWLHGQSIETEKVRGITDEAEIFIRLADALCGFLREALIEHQQEFQPILEKAIQEGYLIRVGEK